MEVCLEEILGLRDISVALLDKMTSSSKNQQVHLAMRVRTRSNIILLNDPIKQRGILGSQVALQQQLSAAKEDHIELRMDEVPLPFRWVSACLAPSQEIYAAAHLQLAWPLLLSSHLALPHGFLFQIIKIVHLFLEHLNSFEAVPHSP